MEQRRRQNEEVSGRDYEMRTGARPPRDTATQTEGVGDYCSNERPVEIVARRGDSSEEDELGTVDAHGE